MPIIRWIGILVILGALIPGPARAAPPASSRGLVLSPLGGLIYGQGEEFLYKYRRQGQFASELIWDLKPLFYLGLALDYGPLDPYSQGGLSFGGALRFGIPAFSGTIENRDWVNPLHDRLSHYSRHDASVQQAVLWDLSLAYSFLLRENLAFKVSLDLHAMYFNWIAEDGYIEYEYFGPQYLPWERIQVHGPGIRYMQNWFILSPGWKLLVRPAPILGLEGHFSYSPLIYASDRDDHLMTSPPKTFTGTFVFGQFYDIGAKLSLFLPRGLDLSLGLSYRQIWDLRGETFVRDNHILGTAGQVFQNGYDGGMGYRALSIELALGLALGPRERGPRERGSVGPR
ncbi:MAG: omptin family outer membrane protease [Treponema sp.]|nr:omptin family outer membrane protease [Treponema sp.]